jgi:hypothetical protein
MTKTTIIDGVEVPILPAKSEEEILNKKTGFKYASKEEFDLDVADPNTDTAVEDLQINQKITVASLDIFGKTK